MKKRPILRIMSFLLLAMLLFLFSVVVTNRPRARCRKSNVSTILLCEEVDSFNDPFSDLFSSFESENKYTLKSLCSITDPNQIAVIVSEMASNVSNSDGFPFIGILCYLVLLDSSSNIVDAAHIVNWKATIVSDTVIREGDKLILSSSPDRRMFYSKHIARIAYDTLLEQCPSTIKKMDDMYQRDYQKTTEEILMSSIEGES